MTALQRWKLQDGKLKRPVQSRALVAEFRWRRTGRSMLRPYGEKVVDETDEQKKTGGLEGPPAEILSRRFAQY